MSLRIPLALLSAVAIAGGAAAAPEFPSFLMATVADFRQQDIAVQIGAASGLLGAFGFSGILLSLPFIGGAARLRANHEEVVYKDLLLTREIEKLEADIAHIAARSPAAALAGGQPPDATATQRLRTANLDPLVSAAEKYAELALNGPAEKAALRTARACVDLVLKLARRSEERESLSRKLHTAEHGAGLRADAPAISAGRTEDATTVLGVLRKACQEALSKGRYSEAIVAIERALAHAVANGLDSTEAGLACRFQYANCLHLAERHFEAVSELDEVIPIWTELRGPKYVNVLAARLQRTASFQSQGRYGEVIEEIDDVLPILREVLGDHDRDVFRARQLFAHALLGLNRDEEALKETDGLLGVQSERLGARDPETLLTRLLKAQIQRKLGLGSVALAEFDAVLASQTDVQGARHPDVLLCRHERAITLLGLGKCEEALAELDSLVPVRVAVLGARHPNVFGSRYRKAQSLLELRRDSDALAELDEFLPAQMEVLGTHNSAALASRYLRAYALFNLNRLQEALTASEEMLADMLEVLSPEHRDVRVAQRMIADIQGAIQSN